MNGREPECRGHRVLGVASLAIVLLLSLLQGESGAASQTAYAGAVGTNNFSGAANAVGADEASCASMYSDAGDQHDGFWNDIGFSVPAGATIDGIEVEYKRSWFTDPPLAGKPKVSIGKDEATLGTPKADDTITSQGCGPSQNTRVLGGPADKWGLTWTPAEINSANFTTRFYSLSGADWGWHINWIRVTVHYTIVGGADLEIVKTVDDGTPNEGDTITYTIALTNNGPDSATNVDVADALPAGVTFVSDTTTQGSYDSATGVWSVGTVADAASDTLTITVTVDAGTAGSSIDNTASVSAVDQADPAPANDSDTASVTVLPPLTLIKKAFLPDGTPIASGGTLPRGQRIQYLLYVNNTGAARSDLSIQDVLDPAFAYQPGTIRLDNSVASCAADTCNAAEEATIFAAVDTGAASTDIVDGDVASYSAATASIDVGDQNVANAQLDILPNAVWAIMFEVKIQ